MSDLALCVCENGGRNGTQFTWYSRACCFTSRRECYVSFLLSTSCCLGPSFLEAGSELRKGLI